ncbi:OsmC family protein [bacterium]|nr:OsmC family protein [bacterium]
MDTHFYTTSINWLGEKKGKISANDSGNLPFSEIEVATPPEFNGHAGLWSPEHLFVASANVCLMSTFLSFAEKFKLEFETFSSEGTGKLEKVEGKGLLFTEIILKPKLKIKNLEDKNKALQVLEKSEKYCLISNSMACKVSLEPEIL